ncbi:Carotenoid 9,10(9',10')-cleavage dioxygenase 1 [Sesamum angolense]|uniref:Carotenoid 9,10(9',10')-cleavage dioxygenase 1 n=1 Tax=Sesamum angolense TaxID=2727404 RepID=A0AAE2BKL0_9LAMI|nr:Carotenoid 9,10(9',10')-cleavage dioxygenase 1 [Sesamum angolense]
MATIMSCCASTFPVMMIRCSAESRSSSPPRIGLPKSSTSTNYSSSAAASASASAHHKISSTVDILPRTIKETWVKLLDDFVDGVFEFVDQPYLPSQSNFAPVDEIGEPVHATVVHGSIPHDFPEGVYIRNDHRLILALVQDLTPVWSDGRWMISYNNRHVETDTFKHEKDRKKPGFLPAIEGDSPAVLLAYVLNWLRFGSVNKYLSNTSVFEHSGKFYSAAENHIPQEIDILTLETRQNWDINGDWTRPFTSHPKKAPGTGELVIMGIYPQKPYFELGIVSADGKKLVHKVDLKLSRCCLCHEIGITRRLIKYNKKGYARIGIMPRYGDADSVHWFEVEPSCTFHIINCYEEDDEVIVLACRARNSIIPGPDFGWNKFEWFSKGFKQIGALEEIDEESEDDSFLSRVYEWRLNMLSGDVAEKNLTGAEYSMDFPIINEKCIGKKNKFGYTQVVNSDASSISGMAKYGGLAKIFLEERELEELIKVEYHKFPGNTFCSGPAFVAKSGGVEEDDGWIITYVHNEDSDVSQVYIVDAKNFSHEPVAKITLPRRVPYGFHGAFMPLHP